MLSIYSGLKRDCEGVSRRELFKIGALGATGLSLPGLLELQASEVGSGAVKDRSVVLLWLQGGPSHIETFDPKMTAPVEIRCMFGEVATSLPGVTFGATFPKIAAMADKLAVVRSFQSGISSHKSGSRLVSSGGNSTEACMGSLYARLAGNNNPDTGMPRNVLLLPSSAGEEYKDFIRKGPERFTSIGELGASYAPFDPSTGAGGQGVENMKLHLPHGRFDDRRTLLTALDHLKRRADSSDVLAGANTAEQQATSVLLGGVADAFDLSKEDPRTVAMYDTGEFTIPEHVLKTKNPDIWQYSPVALGKQLLMARRLCEAGCGYVTVCSTGWDMHGGRFGIVDGIPCLGSALDHALTAFLTDLEQRGLTDEILVVVMGEMGRTPRINHKGGRDHWGNLCSVVFAGGGLPMGQVIGSSDRLAGMPASDQIGVSHVLGTIMDSLLDRDALRNNKKIDENLLRSINAPTIPQLI